MRHLLVTNDFPPKLGGIQSYLWELWRRLPPEDVTVLTTPHPGATAWDAEQPYRVVRTRQPVLLPEPVLRRQILSLAHEVDAQLVVVDPALPLGALAPSLHLPYAVVAHGAEITVPGRLPVSRQLMGHVLRGAALVIAAGRYPLAEAEHAAGRVLPSVVVPPGVDPARFVPLTRAAQLEARTRFGLPADTKVIVSLSRLVPRKGMDTLIAAVARLGTDPRVGPVTLAIGGDGRDRARLERLAGPSVRFLGRVPDDELPALYGSADVFAMLCRDRWLGLEQEGFGIVFLEAAAAGVPAVAGRSGGSHEAVEDRVTGLVVDGVGPAAAALAEILSNDELRHGMGKAARVRVEQEFAYDVLAARLGAALEESVRRGAS